MADYSEGAIPASAIPYHVNKQTLIVAMVIGIIFVVSRTAMRWQAARRFSWGEDGFCWLALVCQICVTGIYLSILDDIYFINEQTTRIMIAVAKADFANAKPHPDMKLHGEEMLRGIWPIQYFFWGCLWSVKFSLLFMFKKLTERVPFHLKMWWGVVIFTSLAFVGCVISQLMSCSDIKMFTTLGMYLSILCTKGFANRSIGGCNSKTDQKLQSISLYYSLAVDVLSDFLSKLPILIKRHARTPR